MKGFFADGIIRCLLYDDFLRPHIPHACLQRIYVGFFVRIYMRVCKKMFIYLGIKRKYTARISCHNFETNGRPYQWPSKKSTKKRDARGELLFAHKINCFLKLSLWSSSYLLKLSIA